MATTILTPNMNLPVPIVGVDPGPDYALNIDACLSILDSHDHTAGNGVLITPSAMNINIDLSFNSHNATSVLSTQFVSQAAVIAPLNAIYAVLGDLYYNDGSGNNVRITQSGGVAGSPGSIGSLVAPASANYSAGSTKFIWQSNTNAGAAMDSGELFIRETNVTSAKYWNIKSPTALAANNTLTLPTGLPGSASYFTSDSSGNMGFQTADQIANSMTSAGADEIGTLMSSIGADNVANSRTRATGSTVGVGGVAKSLSSGTFSTNVTFADTAITNLSVTITTSGRPVRIETIPDGTTSSASFGVDVGNGLILQLNNGSGFISKSDIITPTSSGVTMEVLPNWFFVDFPATGTYIYTLYARATSGSNSVRVTHVKLVASEM